jgi:hypothetical protein
MATKVDQHNNVLPLQQPNPYRVPKKQWKRWPDLAQRVFNSTYSTLRDNQELFLHPKAKAAAQNQWDTTAWNAAWMAADGCQQGLQDIADGVGYLKA